MKTPSTIARSLFMVAAILAGTERLASAQTSISGQDFGSACTGGHYTVTLYKENFENNAASRWFVSGSSGGSGFWQVGIPQMTRDAAGYKQLWYTPSMNLDPRFWLQGPNALVTGVAAGPSVYANDLDGTTTANTYYGPLLPSDRTSYMDVWYYFAHDTTSSRADYLSINLKAPYLSGALVPMVNVFGSATNVNASWVKKTINLDAMGLRGQVVYPSISASDGGTWGVVESAVDDILIYYCQ